MMILMHGNSTPRNCSALGSYILGILVTYHNTTYQLFQLCCAVLAKVVSSLVSVWRPRSSWHGSGRHDATPSHAADTPTATAPPRPWQTQV